MNSFQSGKSANPANPDSDNLPQPALPGQNCLLTSRIISCKVLTAFK